MRPGAESQPARPAQRLATLPAAAVEWSEREREDGLGRDGATLAAGSWEIEDIGARLPQVHGADSHGAPRDAATGSGRPAGLGLLLAASAAVLASSTYLLYQAVVAPILPAGSASREPGAQAVGGDTELPGGRRG
jgi:hypothetical protein